MALVLVLVAVQLPVLLAQGTTARADLAVTDLRVLGTMPEWVEGQARPANALVQANITNVGTASAVGYRLDYYWVPDGGTPRWLNGQEATSFDVSDPEEKPIDRGATRVQPPMDWTLQAGQTGSGAIRAVLTPFGPDQTRANDRRDLHTVVQAHDLDISILGEEGALHNPKETRFFQIQIANLGNVRETVQLQLRGGHADPEDRLADLSAGLDYKTLQVEPGDSGRATLFVDYVFSGAVGAFRASFDVAAATSYGVTLLGSTPALNFSADELPPGTPAKVTRKDTARLVVPPGGPLTTEFQVTNFGSRAEVYSVEAQSDAGWMATVGQAALEDRPAVRIGLMPGQSGDLRMTLHAPADAIPGTPAGAGVRVTSGRPSDPAEANWPFRVKGPAVIVESAAGLDLQPYQGDSIGGPVVLRNDGDSPTPMDTQIVLSVTGAETGTWSQLVPAIAPGGRQTVVLATGQTHTGEGSVAFTISPWSPSGAFHNESLQLDGFVHVPNLTVRPAQPGTGTPGQTVSYRMGASAFSVTNGGNTEESYRATAKSDFGTAALVTSPTFTLAKGETRTIAVDHILPVPVGTVRQANLSVSVSIVGKPALNWTANTTTQIVDVAPPSLEAVRLPPIWALGGRLPLQVNVTDDSAVASVEAVHVHPNGIRQQWPLTRLGGSWKGEVILDAIGNHTLHYIAADLDGNNASTQASVVAVKAIPPPTLSLEGPLEGTVIERNATFQIQVNDTLPLARITVKVEGANKTVWTRNLDPAQTSLGFDLLNSTTGPLVITVEAMNAAGATSTVVRTLTVKAPVSTGPSATTEPTKDTPSATLGAIALVLALLAGQRRRGPPGTRKSRGDR